MTTHPIAAEVADTDEAELGFDGITYEKGASVLKQLVATIGRDAFQDDGSEAYFRRHAWGNATLDGLPGRAGGGRGTSAREWARLWIGDRGAQHHRGRLGGGRRSDHPASACSTRAHRRTTPPSGPT
ncbi:MAG: M1 family aminopeptidase [Chloroflexota bacterium]